VKTILLVDDEYAIVEVLAMLLADEGFAVLTASDLFRSMLKKPALCQIPVVLMSSAVPTAANARLPWAKVLRKPFDFDDLIAWLRKQMLSAKK
jgi:DNA-binding response OmpR family regulator